MRWWQKAHVAVLAVVMAATVAFPSGATTPWLLTASGASIALATVATQVVRREPDLPGRLRPVRPMNRPADCLDEAGEFSAFEWLLANDEVVAEVEAARRKRERFDAQVKAAAAERRLAERKLKARAAAITADLEEWRQGARRMVVSYRNELADAVAAELPNELPSKAINREFVAARVQSYERALETLTDEAIFNYCMANPSYMEQPAMAAERLKNEIMDRLTGPVFRRLSAAWGAERDAKELVERENLMAQVRTFSGERAFVVRKPRLATGRARLQAERDAADLGDDGRLNRSRWPEGGVIRDVTVTDEGYWDPGNAS